MNHLVLPQQPQGLQISRSGLTFDINQTKMWFVRPDPRKRSGPGQVYQSTHQNDLVGTVIGGNPATGGLPSGFGDAHTNYGPNVDPDLAGKVWGPGVTSPSLPAN